MRVSFLILLLLAQLVPSRSSAEDCHEITAAIEAYEKGQLEKAIGFLQCRIDRDSRDYLARKLLSDFYWGENQFEMSIEVARSLETLPETPARDLIRSQLRKRISPLRMKLKAEGASGSGERLIDGAVALSYRYAGKNHVSGSVERTSIILKQPNGADPTTRFTDTVARFGHIGSIGQFTYLDTAVSFAPSYRFVPKVSASATPHYVFSDGSDAWLGLQWRSFDQRTAFDFSAGWILPITRSVFMDSAALFTASSGLLPQIGTTLAWVPQDGWEIRGSVAGGRMIETPTVDANFWETQLNVARPIFVAFVIRAGLALHRSTERHEQRLTLGIDWLI